jgi:cell fate regulator YaaT (PSP1 superfamily)
MAKVVGVKFNHSSKLYYFNPENKDYKKDDKVIVETARGVEFGVILSGPKEVDDKDLILPLKPILRGFCL